MCVKEMGKPGWESLKPSGYTYATPLPESYANERWAAGTQLSADTASGVAGDATAEPLSPEAKLRLLGLKLPPAPLPAGMYRPVRRQGNLIYVSGHGPLKLVSCTHIVRMTANNCLLETEPSKTCKMEISSSIDHTPAHFFTFPGSSGLRYIYSAVIQPMVCCCVQDGKTYDEGKLATAEQLAADGSSKSKLIGTEDGAESAKLVALATLASLKANLGSLDRITSLVKTLGLVNATPEYQEHVAVINGFSNVMRDVFGDEIGIGARSAIGQVRIRCYRHKPQVPPPAFHCSFEGAAMV